MAFAITFPCGKQFKVSSEHAGKRGKCPACGKVFTIPRAVSTPAIDEPPSTETLAASQQVSEVIRTAGPPSKKSRRERWKTIAGVLVLLVGGSFLALCVFVTLTLMQGPGWKEPSLWLVAAISTIGVLIGWPFFKGGTATQVIYMVLCGILPGYVVIKGWEAIEEGRRPKR